MRNKLSYLLLSLCCLGCDSSLPLAQPPAPPAPQVYESGIQGHKRKIEPLQKQPAPEVVDESIPGLKLSEMLALRDLIEQGWLDDVKLKKLCEVLRNDQSKTKELDLQAEQRVLTERANFIRQRVAMMLLTQGNYENWVLAMRGEGEKDKQIMLQERMFAEVQYELNVCRALLDVPEETP